MLATAQYAFSHANPSMSATIPSPLSPRSANARLRQQPMSSDSKSHIPFSKRPIKPNPLIKSKDALRSRRRELFLKSVKNGRDERQWAARGDQILRHDYLSERKRWEAELAQAAPPTEEAPEEEEADLPMYSSQLPIFKSQTSLEAEQPSSDDAREADDFQRREEEDLDALLALMETEQKPPHLTETHSSERYGSDDDDYDSIFLGLVGMDLEHREHREHSALGAEAMDIEND